MPTFLDVHPMKGTSEETLRQLQTSPKDEFGVSHVNILYNPEADKVLCIVDAPNKLTTKTATMAIGIFH